ncbi:MAG TPA: hypothetical protein PK659_10505, partial [Methanothrix sp.]
PGPIYMGRGKIDQHGYDNPCSEIHTVVVRLNRCWIAPKADDAVALILNSSVCGGLCKGCRAFLPWRPGIPDYSDYEEVFRQMAIDLREAWNRAVAEAMESEEYETELVVITSENNYLGTTIREAKQEFVAKPSRKLKVGSNTRHPDKEA